MMIKDVETLEKYYQNTMKRFPGEKKYQEVVEKVLVEMRKMRTDIAVFVPFFDEKDNITYVLDTIMKGLNRYYGKLNSVIICAGSPAKVSRAVLREIESMKPMGCVKSIISYTLKVWGKGFGLRSCWELSLIMGVKAWVSFDADLRSVKKGESIKGFTPKWIKFYLDPVLSGGKDFVSPNYIRHYFDATITNFVVRPIIASYWGYRIEQPIGGDFAGSGNMALNFLKDPLAWYRGAGGFGIDVFETINALENGNIVRIYPGVKIHKPSAEDIEINKKRIFKLVKMVNEVCTTLFYCINKRKLTKNIPTLPLKTIRKWGKTFSEKPEDIKLDFSSFYERFKKNYKRYEEIYLNILPKELYKRLREIYIRFKPFPINMWVKILHNYVSHSYAPELREDVIESFAPLYELQVANFINWIKKREKPYKSAVNYFRRLESEALRVRRGI